MSNERRLPPSSLWAYAYLVLPPQPRRRLAGIRTILDDAHAEAEREGRVWAGRVVLERRLTYLLIVSDHRGQTLEVDRRLAAELTRLETEFALTTPVLIRHGSEQLAGPDASGGNGT